MTTSRKWTQKITFQKMMKKHVTILLRKWTNLTAFVFFRNHTVEKTNTKNWFPNISDTSASISDRIIGCVGYNVVHPTKWHIRKSKSTPLLIQYHSNPTKLIKYENFNIVFPYITRDHDENNNLKTFFFFIFWWSPYCCKFENHTYPKKNLGIFLH